MSQPDHQALPTPVASAPSRRINQGPVMPIGGAEDKGAEHDEVILKRFLELAGGQKAKIAVIPTASKAPEKMAETYQGVFGNLGAKSVDVLDIRTRADANGDATVQLLEGASGIFVTGGAQARLVSLLVGTLVMERVRLRNAEGIVVGGTSAGASILAGHMMVGDTGLVGDSGSGAALKAMVEMVSGFGLLQDVIIDQHFSERGRMGRLLSVLAANPGMVSLGLDEDTAAVIDREGMLEVLGSGMVTIIDGRHTTSDYFEREVGEVLTVVDSRLFVLASGRRFDLDARSPVIEWSPA